MSADIAEDAIVICAADSHFADDVVTTCACGARIVHRPYVPAGATKICMPCAANHIALQRMLGKEVTFAPNERGQQESATYFAKPKGNA